MHHEQECASLELSKKLKELRIEEEYSSGYWVRSGDGKEELWDADIFAEYNSLGDDIIANAPTAFELGAMLPMRVHHKDRPHKYFLNYWKVDLRGKTTWLMNGADDCCSPEQEQLLEMPLEAETEADVRAKMIIFLVENKYVTPEEILCK